MSIYLAWLLSQIIVNFLGISLRIMLAFRNDFYFSGISLNIIFWSSYITDTLSRGSAHVAAGVEGEKNPKQTEKILSLFKIFQLWASSCTRPDLWGSDISSSSKYDRSWKAAERWERDQSTPHVWPKIHETSSWHNMLTLRHGKLSSCHPLGLINKLHQSWQLQWQHRGM